jgi:hypothetical protein
VFLQIKTCNSLDRLIKHTLKISLRERGALQVFHSLDLFGDLYGLLVLDWRHFSLPQLLADFGVISQIEFRAYEDDRYARGVVLDFGVPL